jgi:hypothetical protein
VGDMDPFYQILHNILLYQGCWWLGPSLYEDPGNLDSSPSPLLLQFSAIFTPSPAVQVDLLGPLAATPII